MKPTIGRIVIYRTAGGQDVPAIITGLVAGGATDVHLQLFMPPGCAPDLLSYQWGTPQSRDPADPAPRTWRWPDREGS